MRYCPDCGSQLPEAARFCHMCGTKLEEIRMEEKEFRTVQCPNCSALLEYTGDLEHLHCRYCDTDILLNDEAARIHRIFRARSDARKKEMNLDMDYDLHHQKMEIMKVLMKNPPFFIVSVFLIIYTIGILLQGRLDFSVILWDAILLGGVWRVTNKERKGRKKR